MSSDFLYTYFSAPQNNVEEVVVEILTREDKMEMMYWALGCGLLTFFVFLLATIQYVR